MQDCANATVLERIKMNHWDDSPETTSAKTTWLLKANLTHIFQGHMTWQLPFFFLPVLGIIEIQRVQTDQL